MEGFPEPGLSAAYFLKESKEFRMPGLRDPLWRPAPWELKARLRRRALLPPPGFPRAFGRVWGYPTNLLGGCLKLQAGAKTILKGKRGWAMWIS